MLGIHIGCCREMFFWLIIAGIGAIGLVDVYDLAHRKFTFSVFPPQTSPDFASVFPLNEAFLSDGGVGDDFGVLGVPWCRSKTGQVVEWTTKDLLKGLEEFVPIYETRPVTDMSVMGFDHSFGLWFIARWLKPEVMVDLGGFRGYSTWVLRQAMPETPIVFLSPHNPRKYLRMGPIYVDENCIYNGEYGFTEFEFVSWPNMLDKLGVSDRSRVMLLFEKVEDTAVWTTVARLELEQRGRNFGEKQ